jgi:carboxypeptidase Q
MKQSSSLLVKSLTLYLIFIFFSLTFSLNLKSQNTDSLVIRKIFKEAMTDTTSYHNLRHLCKNIGGRLCGSPEAEEAVRWVKSVMDGMDLDTVFLQETKVRHWVRGNEEVVVNTKNGDRMLNVCAIGGSVGTGKKGITSEVVEVYDYDQLKKLGRENVEGKIVFFNHPPDPAVYYTFQAYGESVKYRVSGAIEAAKYGARAVIVRSATLAHDNFAHTGVMRYDEKVGKIPAMSISTNDADSLSKELKEDPDLTLFMLLTSQELPEVLSYNVIGEIRGSEFPEEVIVFGGHLDSWDTGEGANDDGTGVIQTIEVLRLFKVLNIKPKRTIRVVAFMDEEMNQRGAKTYADYATTKSKTSFLGSNIADQDTEIHLAAIEADRGGTTPFGFSIDASKAQYEKIKKWKSLLYPYGLYYFEKGGSGVDIGGLKPLGTALLALVTDSQRYFDYHHSPNDSFEHVSQRELQLGSFSIAALVYLIDKNGL